MNLIKIISSVLVLSWFSSSSWAMIVEKNEGKPKAATVRKYLKEIDVSAMIKDILQEDRDQTFTTLAESLFMEAQNINLTKMFEPFLQDKMPKKNNANERHLGNLIEEMTMFLRNYYVIFNLLETCRAENRMLASKAKLEPGMVSPENNISLEHFISAYEESDLSSRFLKFQYISNFFCRLVSAYGLLDNSKAFGTIDTRKADAIGFIKDAGGYILFPMDKRHTERLFLPYGDSGQKNKPFVIVHTKAKIETTPGFIAAGTADQYTPLQISHYSGDYPGSCFITSDSYFYFNLLAFNLPDMITSASQRSFAKAILPEIKLNELDQTRCQFFPLPSTKFELKLLDYLFLDDLIKNKDSYDNIEYLNMAIGYEGNDLVSDDFLDAYQQSLHEELIDLAEEEIRAELEELAIQNNNYKNAAKNTSKKSHNEKGSHQNNSGQSHLRVRAEKRVETLKVEGRQKWRHVLRLVNEIQKQYPNLSSASLNITGSHITFHAPNTQSITLVPKHRNGKKDLTIDSGRVNCFVDKLINFAMAQDKK